jgi:triacylglycerol lipase
MPANDVSSKANPLYPGIAIARDVAFGKAPKDVVDIFAADKGAGSRPVLIYVPGGGGEKLELQDRAANAFYDNIGRWATKHGMVGVNMERKFSPTWDGGARDISAMIQWLQANIARYHGNPDRMFIWAHSAGNVPLGTYVGHPELQGPKGVGVKGVVFMSAASFNILPVADPSPMDMPSMMKLFAAAGKTCGSTGPMSTDAALPGRKVGESGGPAPAMPAGAPLAGPGAPPDPAVLLAQSSLPGLKKTTAKILIADGEYDMLTDPQKPGTHMAFSQLLHDTLCADGPAHCPKLVQAKGHSHMSIVFSVDTPDTSSSQQVLDFIHGVP